MPENVGNSSTSKAWEHFRRTMHERSNSRSRSRERSPEVEDSFVDLTTTISEIAPLAAATIDTAPALPAAEVIF